MKELYEARNKLEITQMRAQSIEDADEAKFKVIDELQGLIKNNDNIYSKLINEARALMRKIKILELVYFCQNGRYPDER